MAGNVGVTTRLQAKKIREILGQHGVSGKKKSSRDLLCQPDENIGSVSAAVYNRRSFPLEHESDSGIRDGKRVKTELSVKQRRTLCDRGNGASRPVLFARHYRQRSVEETVNICKPETDAEDYVDNQDMKSQFEALDEDVPGVTHTSFIMETDLLKIADSTSNRSLPPEGIADIDANPDSLKSTIYSREIMEYLMLLETHQRLKPGFLDNSPDVTSRMRGVLMDWLLQVQNHEELKDDTLHMCISLIDRFLSVFDVKMPKLQLVGITCLLIASKFIERFAPEITTLCYLTDNTFVKDQVLHYERLILHTLQFDLARPVCTTFLDRYLQVHDNVAEVECLARYLLDLSVTNVHLASVMPSLKAASAIYLSRLLLLDNVPPWTLDLQYYTNYSQEELREVSSELASLLLKAPDSKFQGARNKYNSEEHSYISQCERVGPGWVLLRLCV